MNILRRIAAVAAASLALALVIDAPASAAADVTLIVHYTDSTAAPDGEVDAQLLDGTAASGSAIAEDSYGQVSTFTFAGARPDATLGFVVAGDGANPGERRYVRAQGGRAEVWLVDGDLRVYGKPIPVDRSAVTVRGQKAYLPHTALTGLLGVTTPAAPIAKNGYVFDGHAVGTVDVLSLYYGRDYHEIAIDHDRGITNSTTSMLNNYRDLDMAFYDVDGFKTGSGSSAVYNLSFGAIERLLQVGTLVHPDGYFLLPPQAAAHAEVTEGDPASVGFDPEKLAEVDAFARQQVADGYSAIAVSVVKDGKLVKNDAWGSALKYSTSTGPDGSLVPAALLPEGQRVAAAPDTVFDLASNTKMYATNYAVQRLVSEGRLDLDQRISTFPGWERFTDANSDYTGKWTKGGAGGIPLDAPTGKSTVTVRDLLHHVGGMIPDPEYPNLGSAGDLWYQTKDADHRAGIIDAISRTPLRYAPRTTFAYSDVDFMILGLLVEQITDQRLDEYMKAQFYGPLGLRDTGYRPLDAGIPAERIAATELNGNTRDGNVSFGTQPDGTPVPLRAYTLRGEVHDEKAYYSMAGVAGHAGLFSTTGDMAVLTQLMLNGGVYDGREYFDKDVAAQFVAPFIGPGNTVNGSTVGLGWRIHSYRTAGYYYFNWGASRSSYGHQGWTGTLTIIDPVHQMTVTILTTRIHSPIVDPPNGFANDALDASDLAPFAGLVYKALERTGDDYVIERSVSAVDPLSVAPGTSSDEVRKGLPSEVVVTDRDGAEHRVAVSWDLSGYDGSEVGDHRVTGSLQRPAWLIPADGVDPLVAEAVVAVTGSVPAVTTQPKDVAVKVGGEARFTASASGTPVPAVRWQVSVDGGDWKDVAGATDASLTLREVALAQSGARYRAVFTNAAGSVTTAAATLTVEPGDGGQGPGTGPGDDGSLAGTGSEVPVWLIGTAAVLLIGGALVLVIRRRSRGSDD